MSFLSNLWSNVKNVFSNTGSYLSDQTASALNSLKSGGAGNFTGPNQTEIPLTTKVELDNQLAADRNKANMTTQYGPGAVDPKTGKLIIYNQDGSLNNYGTIFANPSTISSGSGSNLRTSTYSPTTSSSSSGAAGGATGSWSTAKDEFDRTSSRDMGTSYFDASGHLVVPKVGFGGVTGLGGSGVQTSTPQTGIQGQVGGGGRGFGGAGQGTTGAGFGLQPSDEEQRKQQSQSSKVISQQPTAPNYTQQTVTAMQAQAQQAPIEAPNVPSVIDAGYLNSIQESINSTTNSGLSTQDKLQVYAQLQQNLVAAKTRLDQQEPTPPNAIANTMDQVTAIGQSEDPTGYQRAIDEYKALKSDLGSFYSQRQDVTKTIQALTQAYKPIIDDIKQNPNMPKALARRKIEGLAFTQKESLEGLLNTLTNLNQSIDDQEKMVNDQFGIVTLENNRQNQLEDNARAALSWMSTSGAIGGLTDPQMKQYASILNIPTSVIAKARDAALNPKTEIDHYTNYNSGTEVFFDKNTGKTLYSLPGATKASSDTGETRTDTAATQLYGGLVQQAITAGSNPDDAVFKVNAYLQSKSLPALTTTQLAALKTYAGGIYTKQQNTQSTQTSFNLSPSVITSSIDKFLFSNSIPVVK